MNNKISFFATGIWVIIGFSPLISVPLVQAEMENVISLDQGAKNQSLELFNQAILMAELIEDREVKIKTLADIAIKIAKSGYAERARQVFAQAEKLTTSVNDNFTIYNQEISRMNLAIALAKASFLSEAEAQIKNIKSDIYQAEALNEVATVLMANGQIATAQTMLLKALETARNSTGEFAYQSNGSCANEKFALLAKIATNYQALSQLDSALKIAESVTGCSSASGESGEDYQADAYLGILAKTRQLSDLRQVWESSQKITNYIEKAPVWSALAIAFIQFGDLMTAQNVAEALVKEIPWLNQINSGSELREFGLKERALEQIAVAYANAKDFDRASGIVQMIRTPTAEVLDSYQQYGLTQQLYQDQSLSKIAMLAMKFNQADRSFAISQTIQSPFQKILALLEILAVKPTTTKPLIVTQLTKELDQLLAKTSLSNDSQRIAVMVGLTKINQVEKALKILKSITDDYSYYEAVTGMIEVLANQGKLDRAQQLLKTINVREFANGGKQAIAQQMIKMDQVNQALQLTKTIFKDSNRQDELLLNIVEKLVAQKKIKEALNVVKTITHRENKIKALCDIASG